MFSHKSTVVCRNDDLENDHYRRTVITLWPRADRAHADRGQLNTVAQTQLVGPSSSCENADIAEVAIQRTPFHIHFVQSMNSPTLAIANLLGSRRGLNRPARSEPASTHKKDPP
jgi:hypothetical protein